MQIRLFLKNTAARTELTPVGYSTCQPTCAISTVLFTTHGHERQVVVGEWLSHEFYTDTEGHFSVPSWIIAPSTRLSHGRIFFKSRTWHTKRQVCHFRFLFTISLLSLLLTGTKCVNLITLILSDLLRMNLLAKYVISTVTRRSQSRVLTSHRQVSLESIQDGSETVFLPRTLHLLSELSPSVRPSDSGDYA